MSLGQRVKSNNKSKRLSKSSANDTYIGPYCDEFRLTVKQYSDWMVKGYSK
jgi:hypothetical protein